MDNAFIPIIRDNAARLVVALRNANMEAIQHVGMRYAVYIWADQDITTLSFPREKEGGYVEDAPCVLVGSFCYVKPVLPADQIHLSEFLKQESENCNYQAIIQNCIMVLSHFH